MLYLVPTPIGNLKDITLRALETLKECSLILCEDTKISLKLIRHFDIDTHLESYHKFSERKKLNSIISLLENGDDIALISDAGTPAICDPGALLIQECVKKQITITSLPGACALSVAMSLSGNENAPSQFLGFVPKKGSDKKAFLLKMASFEGFSFAYDTPHQITKTLKELESFEVEIAIFRELTKLHEQIVFGSPKEVAQKLTLKGEFVLMVKGKPHLKEQLDEQKLFDKLTQEFNMSPSHAVKLMADLLNKSKKDLYKLFAQ
ncbi:MAG: 16S rRNA (cytidine(1402)-2'-O)-methyltransferase [Rhabdochlamydiaceae bacterium]|nr:16S rRNA (cytidine(1402)-2'-O)-methyltransferase [Candidatus Amphrikana amoebophyrae]